MSATPEEGAPAGDPGAAAPLAPRDRDAMPRWVPRAVALFFAGAATFLLARWLVARLQSLLIILLVSLFLSFAIEPAVNWLTARGWRRGAATWLAIAVILVVSVVFVVSVAAVLVHQLTAFVDSAPGYLRQAESWVNNRFGIDVSTDELIDEITRAEGPLRNLATRIAGNALGFSATVVGGLFQIFTVGLFTWYLVADGPRLRRTILSFLPARRQQNVLDAWEVAIDKTGGYIYSRALLAGIAASVTWVVLVVVGVPSPVPLALWVGVVSQFLPVVGTYLAGGLVVLVALLRDATDGAVVLGFFIVYQQVENYLLSPRVTARTMALHPAVAFGMVIVGAALLGPVGAVLALPSAAIIQAFGSTLLARHEVVESSLTARPMPRAPSRWARRRPPNRSGGDKP